MRTVEINGVAFPYVWGMGALMIYESLTGESMTGKSIADLSVTRVNVLHYSCLRNGSSEFGYSFAEFVQMLNDRKTVDALAEALVKELERWNQDNAQVVDDGNDESGDADQKKSSQ